jgi:insulysin
MFRSRRPQIWPWGSALLLVAQALLVALALLVQGCSQPAPPPEASLVPVQSPNDSKAYRYIELDNGLRALLISDPDTEKAAASLDVYVGSASNPADRGGLAHFLEHMLFLGTDKYPDSGEYARFVSENGGSRNAYTAFEHTNYFFDIDEAKLPEALDRFGQFFVAPRFDAEYVEREVNAVNAEYQMGLKTDGRRTLDVIREVVNPAHPYSILGVGTTETLASRPEQAVREDLLAFYRRYYSANLMALTVLGGEDLDTLQALVESIFSAVPNHHTTVADIDAPLYLKDSLPMLLSIQPEASQRRLQLSFPMPDYSARYRSKPLAYISNLIGHEGEGSLLSTLKSAGWAEGLGAGTGIVYRGGSAFDISITLTEAGMAQYPQVLEEVFQYIRMLDTAGPQQELYKEQGQLSALQFRFRPEAQPIHVVRGLSSGMQLYAPEDLLRGAYLMEEYQPALISEIIKRYITAENVVITLVDKDVAVDRESEFYATPYSVRTLAPGEGSWRALSDTKPDDRLHLPGPNEFIAENVELVAELAENPATPALVEEQPRLRMWYRQDDEFRVPKGVIYTSFRSDKVNDTAANAAATQLYLSLLQDTVNEYTYPAYLAGLNFSIFAHSRGVSLKVSGYTDKQLILLQRIVSSIVHADLDNNRFENIRADLIRSLENVKSTRAYSQVTRQARRLLVSGGWQEEQIIAELKALNPKSVDAFAQQFWSSTNVDVLVSGNYAQTVVTEVEEALQPLLRHGAPVSKPMLTVVQLNDGEASVYEADVEHEDAVMFWYMQAPDESVASRALTALTAQIIGADYFEELRTQQQLGYVVSAFNWPLFNVPGLGFLVQSPKVSASALQESTQAFLTQMATEEAVTEPQFERHKAALLREIQQPHKNIIERSEYFWEEIARRELDFGSRERLTAALQEIDLAQWRAWFADVTLQKRAAVVMVATGRWDELPTGELIADPAAFKASRSQYLEK